MRADNREWVIYSMIELPEAFTLARQLEATITGKTIVDVIAACTPHKFAWYHGDPQNYKVLLLNKTINKSQSYGGLIELTTATVTTLMGDGVRLRYHNPGESRPKIHQLLIEFDDCSAISASIQMYGGILCFNNKEFDDYYYRTAREKPAAISEDFNEAYFDRLISAEDMQKLSTKAFLATEQRIPGLGNGVLQDILWNAKIHPKRKLATLSADSKKKLFHSIKRILSDMTEHGGRDTEKDLFGNYGAYKTLMSKNRLALPCPDCGGVIRKEQYMGGSVYYCEKCQELS